VAECQTAAARSGSRSPRTHSTTGRILRGPQTRKLATHTSIPRLVHPKTSKYSRPGRSRINTATREPMEMTTVAVVRMIAGKSSR
jgi:hypothetical protein